MGANVVAQTSLWSRYTAKAELVGAAVMRTASDAGAATLLAEAAGPGYVCTASVASHFPQVAAGTRPSGDAAATQTASIDHAPVSEGDTVAAEVVTAAPFAIAETGSVALDEPRADRGRCFLAERLWVLVPEEVIVATLDDGLARLQALVASGAHHPLLMTGPSRTADIERTLTVGVHGPRALVIVVVGQT